jgi:hypothetical protein
VLRPIRLISQLPGIVSSATYIGLVARPVIHGRVDRSATAPMLDGSLDGEYFRQDRMTVLAGRLPPLSSSTEIVLTPRVARLFGTGVGGRVSYAFQRFGPRGLTGPVIRKAYRVAAIVEVPPALTDESDQAEGSIFPPGATRQLLPEYFYAWIGLRLAQGTAGTGALQKHLAALAADLQRQARQALHRDVPPPSFTVNRTDVIRSRVQQAIRPEASGTLKISHFFSLIKLQIHEIVAPSALDGLIVLDGTWSKAKTLWWRNPWLLSVLAEWTERIAQAYRAGGQIPGVEPLPEPKPVASASR